MTHTPGPWEIEQPSDKTTLAYIPDGEPDGAFEALNIFDADGNQVAIIPVDPYLGTSVDDNARLIAAGPDLLAASSPFANEATLYLLPNSFLRCACCNAEPQSTFASEFEHRLDCPVTILRAQIARIGGENDGA